MDFDKYKISKFAFDFELGEYTAIYHAISMEIVYVKKEHYDVIKVGNNNIVWNQSTENIVAELIQRKFIVPLDENEDRLITDVVESLCVMRPTSLRLQLTDVCNLNCTYCQIERNYKHNKGLHMSEDVARRSLKLFAKHAPQHIQKTIILTGGEPLLNYSVIETLFAYAKEVVDSYRFILFTNGTGITKPIAKKLMENNVLVLVSIDGSEKQHNLARKDFAEKGSFENALTGFNICKECGCNVGISGVIGTHNIDQLASEVLDFFMKIKPDSLGLNFPHYLLNADNSKILPMEQYADAIINAYQELRKHGIYLENINRIIEPFVKQKINAKECAALGRGITVLPDGMVGPCKTLLVAGIIGTPLEEIEKLKKLDDDEVFRNWKSRSTYTLEKCKGCVGISICGTGCAYDSYVVNGNINGIDERACILTKKILKFLVTDLYEMIRKNGDLDIIVPSLKDRSQIYSAITLSETDLKRSVGHEI